MGAFQEHAMKGSWTADGICPSGLAFGNNDEPMKTFAMAGAVMLFTPLSAQNLVPNGSFEVRDSCPTYNGYVQYAAGWQNLHTHSADYFNECSASNIVDVPGNQFGYQNAADGQAYVGMATTSFGGAPWYREIVGIQLVEALQPGVPVCLSFQTAMGGFGNYHGNSTMYSSKGLGLKFFTEFPADWYSYLYPNDAALHIDEVPTDTSVWYYVSGLYTPDSAYQFVAIGNFYADSLSARTLIDSSGFGTWDIAYAFVDDVRASFDLSYCVTVVPKELKPGKLEVYPNPCANTLTISLKYPVTGILHVSILDPLGQMVRDASCRANQGRATLNMEALPVGFFILRLSDGDGAYRAVQFVHVSP